MIYDALIVGAGPAGGYLAYHLARAGLKVLAIDKAKFPRDKTCGGGISQKTLALIEFDLTPVIRRRISGAYLTYQNRDTMVKDLPGRGGAAVLRSEFDWYILQQAIARGAEFIGETNYESARQVSDHLEVLTSRGRFLAKYLVGADGVYSRVRNIAFGHDLVSYAPAVEALIFVPANILEKFQNRVVFDFGGMPNGYGWIFPKDNHLNVGVFSIYPRKEISRDLKRFMSFYATLHASTRIEYSGFAIPLKNRKQQFQKAGILLVGDAAGFAESFYGEGIYFALKSARVASEAIQLAFDRPTDHLYTRMVRRQLHFDLRYSEKNARLFYPRQKFGFYHMVRNKRVNSYFAELITGEMSHRECFYKTLVTSPLWLLSNNAGRNAAGQSYEENGL